MSAPNYDISPLVRIDEHPGKDRGISLYLKRDDLLHPEIEGTKWRKLSAILPEIRSAYPAGLLTFGGAFSNHLHAVSAAGRIFGVPTIGVVRGEHANLQNPTLRACAANGMVLWPKSKSAYEALKDADPGQFEREFPGRFVLPEGGSTPQALRACAEIPTEIRAQLAKGQDYSTCYCCVPAGTGCTAAGVLAGWGQAPGRVLVFPVSRQGIDRERLRGLSEEIADGADWSFDLVEDYIFGGFAKLHPPVVDFARAFYGQTQIVLDPIYTAKMMFGVFDLLGKGTHFEPGSAVVVLHTGGQQGWDGFAARYGDGGRLL